MFFSLAKRYHTQELNNPREVRGHWTLAWQLVAVQSHCTLCVRVSEKRTFWGRVHPPPKAARARAARYFDGETTI